MTYSIRENDAALENDTSNEYDTMALVIVWLTLWYVEKGDCLIRCLSSELKVFICIWALTGVVYDYDTFMDQMIILIYK